MKKTDIKSPAMLFLAAFIWGVAFVAQSVGMDYVGPFTFNTVRSIIGGLVLIPCIFFLGKKDRGEEKKEEDPKTLLTGGILCGLCLCVASNFQQFGIRYTTVGKAGFITAMYIVLVPVLGIFLKKRPGKKVWFSVALAVCGLYLLCMTEKLSLGKGDAMVLLCALLFAVHILVIDHFSPKVDGVKLSCIQFLVSGVLSAIPMLFCLAADPLCRSFFLRDRLYIAGHRTEGDGSHSGLSDPQPGIRDLCAGGLGASGSATGRQGNPGLCGDVCSHYPGSAPGQKVMRKSLSQKRGQAF